MAESLRDIVYRSVGSETLIVLSLDGILPEIFDRNHKLSYGIERDEFWFGYYSQNTLKNANVDPHALIESLKDELEFLKKLYKDWGLLQDEI